MTLDVSIPSPIFGGSTGGWLRAAEVEEKYAIEENVDISAVPINHTQVSRAMYPSDIPQEELQQAMNEIDHMQEISRNIR